MGGVDRVYKIVAGFPGVIEMLLGRLFQCPTIFQLIICDISRDPEKSEGLPLFQYYYDNEEEQGMKERGLT